MKWYLKALKKYAVFAGRSRRREFWFFQLFQNLISIGLSILLGGLLAISDSSSIEGYVSVIGGIIIFLFYVITFIPSLSVLVRRLHDVGMSGWWILMIFSFMTSTIFIMERSTSERWEIFAGVLMLFCFLLSMYVFIRLIFDSQNETNRYGESPKADKNIANVFD